MIRVGEIDGGLRQHHERVYVSTAADTRFGTVIDDLVVAGAAVDDVGAATAVDRVGAGTASENVRSSRTGYGNAGRERGRIDVLKIRDIDGVARRLIGVGKVDRNSHAQGQRVDAGSTIDRDFAAAIDHGIVAAARDDGVRATCAIDDVIARAANQNVRAAIADQRVISGR